MPIAIVGLCLLTMCATAFAVLWHAYPFPFEKLDGWPSSPEVTDRTGRPLLQIVGRDDQWRYPVPLAEVSPWLIQATIAVEDERFWSHPGVDVIAVARAVGQNLKAGRVESGASTLTMQVSRMVDDRPRTMSAKIIETIRALHLERQRSKQQILEGYLNIAPYGGNVRGVEAAARAHFGKRAADLSLREAALLAGLPQAPSRYRPDIHPRTANRRCEYVLHRMVKLGMITEQQRSLAMDEAKRDAKLGGAKLGQAPNVLFGASPSFTAVSCSHAAWFALRRRPGGGRTTIDVETQRVVERLVAEHVAQLPRGADVAVVVIDIPTGDILALAGSADPDDPVDGQVNGVLARRSPGSALKPFLYAAAFEARTLHPDSLLEDGPVEFAGWSPMNFDRTFSGEVSAAEALRRSLNVPAIRVTEATGLPRCLGTLEAAGIRLPPDADRRGGLAVAVGGIEVTLLDLVNGYATLGRNGVRRDPRLFLDEVTSSVPALDANVCAAINEILSSRHRAPASLEGVAPDEVAWFMWKTGTSSGRRDAWAVGHNHRSAIGVWAGRFSGAGHTDFVGNTAAEPLLAKLFSLPSLRQDHDPKPANSWEVASPLTRLARKQESLRITAPSDGDVFPRVNGNAVVHPHANVRTATRWFLNGLLVSSECPDRLVLNPGSYTLRCVGANGEFTAVRFRVE